MSLKKVESDPDLINDRTEQLALKMIEFLESKWSGSFLLDNLWNI